MITALYRAGATRVVDNWVLLRLREVQGAWIEVLANADDLLFRPTPTFVAAIVLAIILWRLGPRWSWCAPCGIALTALAEAIIKNGFSQVLHPRALLDGILVLFGGHYHAPSAFPSGHVTRATFLAVIALAYLPRKVSVPFALLASTTLLARMYTEQHRLVDVLGGAALGVFVACVSLLAAGALSTSDRSLRELWRGTSAALVRRFTARSAT